MEEKMILKRLLSPLPHPSSHLPYCAASCPLFIFAVGFEWQGDKQGWWRVLFAAVGLIDRWGVGGCCGVLGVSLRLSWMKSNMWTSHTPFLCVCGPQQKWHRGSPKLFGLWLWKVSFFYVAYVSPFVQETIVFYDLLWPYHPSRFSILNDSAGTQCIVLLPILVIQCTPAACDWFSDQLQH